MSPIVGPLVAAIGGQNDHMGSARTDFVITTRAAIRLWGTCGRDLPNFVLIAVRPGFDPPALEEGRQSALPARRWTTPW